MILGTTRATAEGATLKLYQNSASPAVDDSVGMILFSGNNDAAAEVEYALIEGIIDDATAGAEFGSIAFSAQNGTGSDAECGYFYHDGSYGSLALGDFSAPGVLTSVGNFDLILRTGNSTTGTFTITDGAGGDMTFATNGTGSVVVDQDGDAIGLEIDSEATTTTNYALKVATGQGSHNALFQESSNNSVAFLAASSGVGSSWFYRNLAAASTGGPLVFIEQDEATDDQPALSIQQDGTGYGAFIDQNGDGAGLYIDSEATTATNYGLQVITGQGASAALIGNNNSNSYLTVNTFDSATAFLHVYRNLAAASTAAPVMDIVQDNAGDDQNALTVQQDGTGLGAFIDQNGDAVGLHIDTEATTATSYGLHVQAGQGASVARFEGANTVVANFADDNSNGSFFFNRNAASGATTGPVMKVRNDNAGDNQVALLVQQDAPATAIDIDQNGDAIGLDITSLATTNTNYALNVVADSGAHPFRAATDANDFYLKEKSGGAASHYFYRNETSATTAGEMVLMVQDNASDDQVALKIQQDAPAPSVDIDANASASVVVIDQDSNDANAVYGIDMSLVNAGAGVEHAFKFGGSEAASGVYTNNVVAANPDAYIAVDVGGATFYVPAYTAQPA